MEVLRILPNREVMITEFQPTQINILYFFTVQSRACKQKHCIGMSSLCDLITLPCLLTDSLFLMLAFLIPVYSKDTSEPTLLGNACCERRHVWGPGMLPGTSISETWPFLSYTSLPVGFKLHSGFFKVASQVLQIMKVLTTYRTLSCFNSFSCDDNNSCNRTTFAECITCWFLQ